MTSLKTGPEKTLISLGCLTPLVRQGTVGTRTGVSSVNTTQYHVTLHDTSHTRVNPFWCAVTLMCAALCIVLPGHPPPLWPNHPTCVSDSYPWSTQRKPKHAPPSINTTRPRRSGSRGGYVNTVRAPSRPGDRHGGSGLGLRDLLQVHSRGGEGRRGQRGRMGEE